MSPQAAPDAVTADDAVAGRRAVMIRDTLNALGADRTQPIRF
jgi:hypothetical protein